MRISVLVAVLVTLAVQVSAACSRDQVSIRGSWGHAEFGVKIADTPQSRGKGLMFVEHMPQFSGMLFIYENPQPVAFWMRNTLIPLDMLFIDKTGVIKRIHHNAIPKDETPIPGGRGILMVLEINGGMARKLGITQGSEIQYPALGKSAVWPCN